MEGADELAIILLLLTSEKCRVVIVLQARLLTWNAVIIAG